MVIAQSVEIVTYIDKFRKSSDAVDKEISYLSDSKANPRVNYWNGSTVVVVSASDNSRGSKKKIKHGDCLSRQKCLIN